MPNGKDVYYFSHDTNARNDEKILMLRAEHGWEGYGLYWALLEMMFDNKETCIKHSRIRGIAVSYNVDITMLQSVIDTAVTEGLFISNGECFWSESLRRRKQAFHELRDKRSKAGKKGMETRWGKADDTGPDNSVITKNNKVKESKVKESRGKESKGKESKTGTKFTPPAINEINQYCKERNNDVDPNRFHDHYSAKGWMIGKNKMKDWQAAVRTWERSDNSRGSPMASNASEALRLAEKFRREEENDQDRDSATNGSVGSGLS